MINETTNRPAAPMTHAERLARFSAATPTITMPDRPTDRSRNHQRGPRPSPKRRIIR